MHLLPFAFLACMGFTATALAQEKISTQPQTAPQTASQTYQFVEEMPEFPGGEQALMKYLQSHIVYPKKAQEHGIEGRCYVGFVVDAMGNITDVAVKRPLDPDLDAEAVRVVKAMPTWKPGRQNGKTVAVAYTLPIGFRLDNIPANKK